VGLGQPCMVDIPGDAGSRASQLLRGLELVTLPPATRSAYAPARRSTGTSKPGPPERPAQGTSRVLQWAATHADRTGRRRPCYDPRAAPGATTSTDTPLNCGSSGTRTVRPKGDQSPHPQCRPVGFRACTGVLCVETRANEIGSDGRATSGRCYRPSASRRPRNPSVGLRHLSTTDERHRTIHFTRRSRAPSAAGCERRHHGDAGARIRSMSSHKLLLGLE
jgi:hypothetical protein